jgi:uroporphyrinogen decarboxylase
MTSRELVIRTLNHRPVPRVPRDLWIPAGEDSPRADELAEMDVRFPRDIVQPELTPAQRKRTPSKSGKTSKTSELIDEWGCIWHVERGAPPELKHSPLADTGKIASYQPPAELLDRSRFAKVNRSCQVTTRFVLAWSEARIFDRLRFLRGHELALMDLARGTSEIRSLLGMLHDLACQEIELWADTEVDGVVFRDDWGTPDGLLVAPEMWREIFRPMYRDYCRILHAKDKFAFFQSGGNLFDIFGDLVKIGIDAIHCQWESNDLERLSKR